MREIKFRAMLSDKYYAHPRMAPWDELLEIFDALHVFDEDCMKLMQYTGLHDKNGREIYEGDIVRYTAWHDGKPMGTIQGEVVYGGNLGMASFGIRLDHNGEIDRAVLPAMGVEIMGNVYENPELMEMIKHDGN